MKYRFKKLYSGEPIDYRIRVIPTRPLGAGVGVTSAPVLIKSVEQFRSFVDGAHYGWQWDQARLDDLFKKYNASFFETRVLVAGVVSASSGSTRVTVSDVIKTETGVRLFLRLESPEIGTADMMSWHYFVELLAEDVGDGDVSTNLPVSKDRSRRGFPDVIIADR